jgi:hypothetical protein
MHQHHHSVIPMACFGFILFSPDSSMQALHILLLVIKPQFSHFCFTIGFFFYVTFMLSAEWIVSMID